MFYLARDVFLRNKHAKAGVMGELDHFTLLEQSLQAPINKLHHLKMTKVIGSLGSFLGKQSYPVRAIPAPPSLVPIKCTNSLMTP